MKQSQDSKDSKASKTSSFEGQLAQLQNSLKLLEQGNLSLDESLCEYERGLQMLKSCRRYLEDAERKIELMTTSENGDSRLQEFHHEAWKPYNNSPKS